MRYGGNKFALGDKTSKEKSQDSTTAIKLYQQLPDFLVFEYCLDNRFL